MTKELAYVMLEPHDVRMKSSNVRKKVMEPPNVKKKKKKKKMKPSNVRKK